MPETSEVDPSITEPSGHDFNLSTPTRIPKNLPHHPSLDALHLESALNCPKPPLRLHEPISVGDEAPQHSGEVRDPDGSGP